MARHRTGRPDRGSERSRPRSRSGRRAVVRGPARRTAHRTRHGRRCRQPIRKVRADPRRPEGDALRRSSGVQPHQHLGIPGGQRAVQDRAVAGRRSVQPGGDAQRPAAESAGVAAVTGRDAGHNELQTGGSQCGGRRVRRFERGSRVVCPEDVKGDEQPRQPSDVGPPVVSAEAERQVVDGIDRQVPAFAQRNQDVGVRRLARRLTHLGVLGRAWGDGIADQSRPH